MRRLFVLAVFAVLAGVPVSAHANSATLWACHGPTGAGLPFGYTASESFEAAFTTPNGGCGATDGTLRLGFLHPDLPASHSAALRFAMPTGVIVDGLLLGRRVTGPGYWAKTSTTELESLDQPGSLDGTFRAAGDGQWVELGVRCGADPATVCDAAGPSLDFRFAAVSIRDEAKPTFNVSSVPGFGAGTIGLVVDAKDAGVGLAGASATLAGATVASVKLGQRYCDDLTPGDGAIDLPLAEDCPSASRLTLSIDTTKVADGPYRLELAVADGVGNTTSRSYDLKVLNHPPVVTPTPTPAPTPAPPRKPSVPPSSKPVADVGVLRVAKQYAVSRTGALTVDASCPAAAPASCKLSLKLTARLPGHKKTATIASASKTAKHGARAKITLKLSSSARSALSKKHKLSAVLTLAGAAPVKVQLKR